MQREDKSTQMSITENARQRKQRLNNARPSYKSFIPPNVSNEYVTLYECRECDTLLAAEFMRVTDKGICKDCHKKVTKKRRRQLRDIADTAANGCWWIAEYLKQFSVLEKRANRKRLIEHTIR